MIFHSNVTRVLRVDCYYGYCYFVFPNLYIWEKEKEHFVRCYYWCQWCWHPTYTVLAYCYFKSCRENSVFIFRGYGIKNSRHFWFHFKIKQAIHCSIYHKQQTSDCQRSSKPVFAKIVFLDHFIVLKPHHNPLPKVIHHGNDGRGEGKGRGEQKNSVQLLTPTSPFGPDLRLSSESQQAILGPWLALI